MPAEKLDCFFWIAHIGSIPLNSPLNTCHDGSYHKLLWGLKHYISLSKEVGKQYFRVTDK